MTIECCSSFVRPSRLLGWFTGEGGIESTRLVETKRPTRTSLLDTCIGTENEMEI